MERTNPNTMHAIKKSNNSDVYSSDQSLTASDKSCAGFIVPETSTVGEQLSPSSNVCPNYAQVRHKLPATSGPTSKLNIRTAVNGPFTSNSTSNSEGALVSALTSISNKLDHLSLKVDASNCEVKQLYESLTKALQEVKTVKFEIAEVKQQVAAFQTACNNELIGLKATIDGIDDRIQALEIAQRSHNIRVAGLPESENDLGKFIQLVKERFDIDIQQNDISHHYRVGPLGCSVSPRHLVVSFVRRNQRNNIFKKKTKLRGFNIFLNEDLIPNASRLFAAARRLVQVHVVYRTWSFNGQIYIKANVDSPQMLVSNMAELDSFHKPESHFITTSSTETETINAK